MARKLLDMLEPLEPLEFPNGRELAVRRWDGDAANLANEVAADPTNIEKGRRLLRHLVPDATDADWASIGGNWKLEVLIVGYAREMVDEMAEQLKNVDAGALLAAARVQRPRPSNRPTKSTTSSRGSRGRTGKTSPRSTPSPTP
jgi:thiamine pyrophosphate-dependent acetolactate synthase large subunit-like protein